VLVLRLALRALSWRAAVSATVFGVALIGVLAGFEGDTSPHPLMLKGASLHGIFVGSRAHFEHLCAAIDVNRIKPVIDRTFGFEAAADAYRHQLAGAFGKVVIRI